MKNFKCGVCDRGADTEDELRKHYRDKHPSDGYSCWDAIGLGDPLADSAMRTLQERHNLESEEIQRLRTYYQEVIRNANIARMALDGLPK